jgi:hypothetical protein
MNEELPTFVSEAIRIVEAGKENGIILRIMGACAVRIHCSKRPQFILKRKLTDVDLMSYSRFEPSMEKFFKSLGYDPLPTILPRGMSLGRHIYHKKEIGFTVDVFFDKLEFCHTIDFRGRLELDFPTITLADIMLEKLQIVKISEKDILDLIALLHEHEIGMSDDKDVINGKYMARLLSKDWGFYYTVTINLNKVKSYLQSFESLTDGERKVIAEKIDKLLQLIENEPKTLNWKLRAKIGPSMKWYRDVESSPLEQMKT